MADSVGEEMHLTFEDEDDDLVLEKKELGLVRSSKNSTASGAPDRVWG